ncbi:MAG: hypothetical protein Udaeo_08990 [Candidatus Udaeobacter sp.]|nr:MAG: hypothetical protein Udaeo_08990 [Candidatus Udaeobacter sp.]
MSGVKSAATIQEVRTAITTTAKSVKVYSPAELLAKPTGTKPSAITRVPVSLGYAVEA